MIALKRAVLGVVVLASWAGVANAAQITVFEKPLELWDEEVSATFAVNRELGRAWIDVQVASGGLGDELPVHEVISKRIDGLVYDSARKQVLYRTPTETIVCAEDATFLWSTYLKSTGRCPVTSVAERRNVDDGFNVSERRVAKVVLNVGD